MRPMHCRCRRLVASLGLAFHTIILCHASVVAPAAGRLDGAVEGFVAGGRLNSSATTRAYFLIRGSGSSDTGATACLPLSRGTSPAALKASARDTHPSSLARRLSESTFFSSG